MKLFQEPENVKPKGNMTKNSELSPAVYLEFADEFSSVVLNPRRWHLFRNGYGAQSKPLIIRRLKQVDPFFINHLTTVKEKLKSVKQGSRVGTQNKALITHDRPIG